MRLAVPAILALALAGCSSSTPDAPPPAALVTSVSPHQGETTRWITAFGSATPASNGVETLSIPQPGRVEKLLVTAGAPVHAGQPILIFALAPTAQAAFESAVSTLKTAREQRATTARLLGQQLATQDQLAQTDKALADATAALNAARAEGGGQATQTVRAPFDGIVATIPVAQGDRTQPGAPLATVARKTGIILTVGVDPADRPAIQPGQPARLQPLDGGTAIDGHVLRIDGQLNTTTRLIDVDLTIPPGAILNGQPMKAEIAGGSVRGWVVPHESVVTDDDGVHIFQIVGGKAKAVPVQLLQAGKDSDVVSGAIDAGRPIIVNGAYQIDDGGVVRTAH